VEVETDDSAVIPIYYDMKTLSYDDMENFSHKKFHKTEYSDIFLFVGAEKNGKVSVNNRINIALLLNFGDKIVNTFFKKKKEEEGKQSPPKVSDYLAN
jgi:hypothetical protein